MNAPGERAASTAFREALRHGLAAASLTIESPEAAPAFGENEFQSALQRVAMPKAVAFVDDLA